MWLVLSHKCGSTEALRRVRWDDCYQLHWHWKQRVTATTFSCPALLWGFGLRNEKAKHTVFIDTVCKLKASEVGVKTWRIHTLWALWRLFNLIFEFGCVCLLPGFAVLLISLHISSKHEVLSWTILYMLESCFDMQHDSKKKVFSRFCIS